MAAKHTLWQCARWGSTTVVDVGSDIEMCNALVRANTDTGLRLYIGPKIVDANYVFSNSGVLEYDWDVEAGSRMRSLALALLRDLQGEQNGLIGRIVVPWQVDTCTTETLVACKELAHSLGVPLQTHISQNLFEFHEIARRHGRTPVGLLDSLEMLDHGTILGHAIFLSGTSSTRWPGESDAEAIARGGSHVAHCPAAYARLGYPVLDIDWYQRRGINVGLGTDTYPRDIIDEMRHASMVGKLMTGDAGAASAPDVFGAATIGGARALGRDDLGRISPGARADLCIIDMAHPRFGGVVYDPIRSLVECGIGDVIGMTLVDGAAVYDGQTVSGIRESPDDFAEALGRDAHRVFQSSPSWHWSGHHVSDAFPPAYLLTDLTR